MCTFCCMSDIFKVSAPHKKPYSIIHPPSIYCLSLNKSETMFYAKMTQFERNLLMAVGTNLD